MLAHLIKIEAKTSGGSASTLYLSSVNDPTVCHINGQQWQPNIARLPTLRYDFFGGVFSGQITAPEMQFTVSIDGISDFVSRYYASAPVTLYEAEAGSAWGSYSTRFAGIIVAEPEVRDGIATFTARVDDAWLDTPLLDTYAGTGDADATEDKTGLPKFLTFGNVRFADAVLIEPTDLVYQVHGGAVNGIVAAYDRVASLGTSTGDYADYAALVAASIPPGGWGTCKALGLVRLGAPPDGRVAFDVQGGSSYARKPGAIIAAVAAIAGGTVDSANLSALDTACPYNLQIQITQQTTAREVIQSIADSVGAVAGVTWTGTLFVQPLAIDASPAETLAADGTSDIAVDDVAQIGIASPFWRLAIEAEPTFVVYSLGEVASGYNWRGTYSASRQYRLDDAVFASDGRAFAYINATASAGNAPPTAPSTSNSYWGEIGAATVGAPSGTTVGGRDADDIAGTIAAGGGVDVDQVSKEAIQADAVTAPYLVQTGVQVMSISTSAQTITGLSFTANIPSGEVLDVDFNTFPMWAGNDGTRFSLDAYLLRDGVTVATFGQIMDTNDMATNNQGGFAVPVGLFARVDGNGSSSTYSVNLQLGNSRSESNSGSNKNFQNMLDFRLNQSQLRARRYSR